MRKRNDDSITAAKRVVENFPAAIGSPNYNAIISIMTIQAIDRLTRAVEVQTRTMRAIAMNKGDYPMPGEAQVIGHDEDTGTAIIRRP
jgi:hypothetical protein